ncbi:MAG: peptidylprolyl isomerase, partial [Calditrichaeota bacterium]|nr:peptidylprolyl isomerase [Calditrichota bacterium]
MTRKYLKFFITILLFFYGCSDKSTEEVIVAKVGEEKITLEEVKRSFVLNPRYAIRTPLSGARESQLQYIINQQYYLLAAREVNLSQDSPVGNRIEYIKNRETIKAFIQEKFLKNIEIPAQELQEALNNLGKSFRVKHLFTSSESMAVGLYRRLQGGEDFDRLAYEVFSDPYLQETGGNLGYLGFGDLDPALEERVFNMQPGEISQPVRSAYGYHILNVTDISENEQMSQMTEPMKLELVKEILKTRQADDLVRNYLSELADDRKIEINNRILDLLATETQRQTEGRYDPENVFQPPIRTSDLMEIEAGLNEIKTEVLVRFGEYSMNVQEFLDRLKLMPPLHRPYLSTRNRIAQTIIDMIRNDLIAEQARKAGISSSEELKNKTEEIINEFLAG